MSRASPAALVSSVAVGALLVLVLAAGACRVGPPVADALRSPYPDGAGIDLADSGDVAPPPCDLLKQDCANHGTCYPVDGIPGATACEPLPGSAPPTTLCVMSQDCDVREACIIVPESQTMMCVTLCDPTVVQTGCQRAAPCRLLPGYRVGYCVP